MQTLGSPVGVAGCAGHRWQSTFWAHLPPGVLILSWDVHGAGLRIYFGKFLRPELLSPAPGVRHLSLPQDFWSHSRRGEGAGGLRPLKATLPLGISCGHFSRTSPLLRLGAQTPTGRGSRTARDASAKGSALLPTRGPLAPPPQVPPRRARMLDPIPTPGPSFP